MISRETGKEYLCPHCNNPIYDEDALLCCYCGENLERPVGFIGKMKYSSHWMAAGFVIVIFLMFAFLIWMIL
ncbi:MAG: hypothetical protein ABH869_01235 [Candidatus Omnitrophota bacterium]